MARRTKATDARVEAILASLRVGNTRRAASAAGDINNDTFYEWMRRDPAFSGAVVKAEADAEARFLRQVAVAATDGSWQAAAWWLERRKHEDFGRRDRVDMSLDLRREAEKVARDLGMTIEEVLAEAEAVLASSG